MEKFAFEEGDFTRNRKLSLVDTIGAIISMALRKNASGYDISLQNYFAEEKKDSELKAPSRSAFTQARSKLQWRAFEHLLKSVNCDQKFKLSKQNLWNGKIVRAIDGTRVTLPHSKEILEFFPQSIKNGKHTAHYPNALMLTSMNVFTGQVCEAIVDKEYRSEMSLFFEMIERFEPGDVCLLDRYFFSRRMAKRIDELQQYFIARAPTRLSLYRMLIASGEKSRVFDFGGVQVKLICTDIVSSEDGQRVVVATNMIHEDESQIVSLYKKRWETETLYYRLKCILHVERFHSRSVNGVMQEIFAHLFVLSLVGLLAIEAESSGELREDEKPNIKNVAEVVRRHFKHFISPPGSERGRLELAQKMAKEILSVRCRIQPGRNFARVSNQPHNKWTQHRREKYADFEKLKTLLT